MVTSLSAGEDWKEMHSIFPGWFVGIAPSPVLDDGITWKKLASFVTHRIYNPLAFRQLR